MKRYRSLHVDAPAELEEEIAGWLFAAGGEGSWTEALAGDRIRIHAFFDESALPDDAELSALEHAFVGVERSPLVAVPHHDWSATWRAAAQPIAVGERFLIDPREPGEVVEPLAPERRTLLRLPARTAFGTGGHESTRLLLELLEQSQVVGRRVLDVGTGSGILAFAALALGAAEVAACDLDPAAALLLPQFMSLNGRRFGAWTGTLQSLHADGRFDLALVNVVPEEIAADLPRLADAMAPGGRAYFSGILGSEVGRALQEIERHGFREVGGSEDGEWVAVIAERTP